MPPTPVVVRSARAGDTNTLLVDPFKGGSFSSPGGTLFHRDYDAGRWDVSGASVQPATLNLYLDPSARIIPASPASNWFSFRGGDCRAFDRRLGAEIYGPSHPFSQSTDLVITNGLLSAWMVGGGLQVAAFDSTKWVTIGVAWFGALSSPSLKRVTPDSVALSALRPNGTTVTVELRRGERMLRCSDSPSWQRFATYQDAFAGTYVAGKFGQAAHFSSTEFIDITWPATTAKWSFAGWWIPDAASGSQAGSCIWGLMTSAELAAALYWRSGRLEWVQGGVTLASSALTFSAGQPVFIGLAYANGTRLMGIKTSGSIAYVTDTAGTGSTQPNYSTMFIAPSAGDFGGYADTYADAYSGTVGTWASDNAMIFSDGLSTTEMTALSAATSPLGSLPAPESRLVWYSPFDDVSTTPFSTAVLASGNGYGAAAVTNNPRDDAASQTAQLGARFEQHLRLR